MKTELTEIRNQLYDSLPTGDIASAYDIICRVNDHLKRLDAFIDKLPQADVIKSVCDCMQNLYKDGIYIKCKKCNKTVNIQEQTVL